MKRSLRLAFLGIFIASSQLSAQDPDLNGAREYCDRGQAFLDKGEYDKAIADYTEAIKLDPKDAMACFVAYYNRGVAYGKKGDSEKAVADYTEAIRLDPYLVYAYVNRGLLYVQKGELDKARPSDSTRKMPLRMTTGAPHTRIRETTTKLLPTVLRPFG